MKSKDIMQNDSVFSIIKEGTLFLPPELKNGIEKISDSHDALCHDETNNVRKLLFRQGGFNNSIDEDFILGGIFVPSSSLTNPDYLRTVAPIKTSVKKAKSRTLRSKN